MESKFISKLPEHNNFLHLPNYFISQQLYKSLFYKFIKLNIAVTVIKISIAFLLKQL
jgi:hypothetical protein